MRYLSMIKVIANYSFWGGPDSAIRPQFKIQRMKSAQRIARAYTVLEVMLVVVIIGIMAQLVTN